MIDKIFYWFRSTPKTLQSIAWEAANANSLEELEALTQQFKAEATKRLVALEAWNYTQANRGAELCIEGDSHEANP